MNNTPLETCPWGDLKYKQPVFSRSLLENLLVRTTSQTSGTSKGRAPGSFHSSRAPASPAGPFVREPGPPQPCRHLAALSRPLQASQGDTARSRHSPPTPSANGLHRLPPCSGHGPGPAPTARTHRPHSPLMASAASRPAPRSGTGTRRWGRRGLVPSAPPGASPAAPRCPEPGQGCAPPARRVMPLPARTPRRSPRRHGARQAPRGPAPRSPRLREEPAPSPGAAPPARRGRQ